MAKRLQIGDRKLGAHLRACRRIGLHLDNESKPLQRIHHHLHRMQADILRLIKIPLIAGLGLKQQFLGVGAVP